MASAQSTAREPHVYAQESPPNSWPRWPYLLCLWVLFLGPLAAPLFQATHLPLLADSGTLARDLLSMYVCPTPAKSYVLFGFPMAVCARCWGATIGLWLAYLAIGRDTRHGGRDMRHGTPDTRHGGRSTLRPYARHDTRHDAPVARHDTRHDAPVTRHDAPVARHDASVARHDGWISRHVGRSTLRPYVVLPFLLWVAEIRWWPGAPYWVLLLNGAIAGFAAGLFFCSLWPGMLSAPVAER